MTEPVIPHEFNSGVKVVNIGDVRVARGLTRRHQSTCPHKNLVYDTDERRIYCKDCESDVEAFDAFTVLADGYAQAVKKLHIERNTIEEAKNHSLHLIAAKNLEKYWRSKQHVPVCPHCHQGLLPDDFKGTHLGATSRELEVQRRRNKAKS